MTLELNEPHHGSGGKNPADSPNGTVDPRALFNHQLLLQQQQEYNFVIRHSSPVRDGAEEAETDRHSSPPVMGRPPSQEPRKFTPSLLSHQQLQGSFNKNSILLQTGQHPISSCSPVNSAISSLQDTASFGRHRNISDTPLDFSTKKSKFESGRGTTGRKSGSSTEDLDAHSSRLRNILSMKSPSLSEDLLGTVLNLSKESALSSPASGSGWNSTPSHGSSSDNSGSPSPNMDLDMSPSPKRHSTSPPSQHSIPISTAVMNHMAFSPYGIFNPNMAPIMGQGLPGSGISINFDPNSPSLLQVTGGGAGSPTLPFGNPMPLPQTNSAAAGNGSKTRVTRPFKAYPKDPMSFPTMGLYGIPVGAPAGTNEALIHQQSNHAYAEFRQHMLNQTQTKSKRGGAEQKNSPANGPLSDSTTSSTNPLNYGLGMIEPGAMSSGADDYLSTSDDGYGSLANKGRIIKSEEQQKDEAYWERRRKNNEAAKRSRDARRAKEDEIAIRASFLEQENLKLRFEVCALKNETAKLRCMLYNRQQ